MMAGEGGPFENCDHYDPDVVGDNDFDCGDQPYLFIGIGCITILKHPMVQINFLYMYAFASTSKGFKIKTDCMCVHFCPKCVFKCFIKWFAREVA